MQQDSIQQPKGSNGNSSTGTHFWLVRFRSALVGFVVAIVAVGAYREFKNKQSQAPQPNENVNVQAPVTNEPISEQDSKKDKIVLESPTAGSAVSSPLKFSGRARGTWYFEASFPVVLVDWDGRIIAQSHAEAQIDPDDPVGAGWMTEDFVPFEGTISFPSPYKVGDQDFMKRGALILQKDNPSGLPEHDDALEIPIVFGGMM